MKLRQIGQAGPQVSVVGLGCNNFGYMSLELVAPIVDRALDLGVTLFDTADAYGRGVSESVLGEALGARRKNVVIATKFGMPMDDAGTTGGSSRRYIIEACETSLKRLGTDWIDLYQTHRPDPATPIEETMRALDDLVCSGKVRAIGSSNLPPETVVESNRAAREAGLTTFVSAQEEYSLLARGAESELVPALEAEKMSLLPYFPLAGGMLTGKYHQGEAATSGRLSAMKVLADKYMTQSNWDLVVRLETFARDRGHSLLDLAFAWLLAHPFLASVIAGATRVAQVEANVAAGQWGLTPDEVAEMNILLSEGR